MFGNQGILPVGGPAFPDIIWHLLEFFSPAAMAFRKKKMDCFWFPFPLPAPMCLCGVCVDVCVFTCVSPLLPCVYVDVCVFTCVSPLPPCVCVV